MKRKTFLPDKFNNKYRITTAGAKWWDYHHAAAYFITICTQNRIHYFDKIIDQKIQLSVIGKIVEQKWLKTPDIRSYMI